MEDNLKRDWRETSIRSASNESTIEAIKDGHRKSALQRLASRYRMFSIIGAVCSVSIPMILHNPGIFPENPYKIWALLIFCLYFLTCSAMDLWLYHGITGIDVATMSVSEVISRALFYRKRHLQFVMVLLPWAFVIVGILIYFNEIRFALYGMIAGGTLGLIVGINQLRRFMADYRDVTRD